MNRFSEFWKLSIPFPLLLGNIDSTPLFPLQQLMYYNFSLLSRSRSKCWNRWARTRRYSIWYWRTIRTCCCAGATAWTRWTRRVRRRRRRRWRPAGTVTDGRPGALGVTRRRWSWRWSWNSRRNSTRWAPVPCRHWNRCPYHRRRTAPPTTAPNGSPGPISPCWGDSSVPRKTATWRVYRITGQSAKSCPQNGPAFFILCPWKRIG